MQGLQGHDHLDGGTVGIGDDALVPGQVVGVHLRHDQRNGRIHAPGAGVVHHHATGFGRTGGELLGGGTTGGKQSQVHALEGILGQFLNRQLFRAKLDGAAGGTGRCQSPNFRMGKITAEKGIEHFPANGACRANHGHYGVLFHRRLRNMSYLTGLPEKSFQISRHVSALLRVYRCTPGAPRSRRFLICPLA